MDDLSAGVSVCPMHCGQMADHIRMPFGVIGRMGPGMRHVEGFGDRSTGRHTFGGEFGAHHCNQWGLTFAAMRSSSEITLGKLDITIVMSHLACNKCSAA